MPDIEIKSSSLARRCEICHQADLYDANSNICARCANIPLPTNSHRSNAKRVVPYKKPDKVFTNLLITMVGLSILLYFTVSSFGFALFFDLFLKYGIPTYVIPLIIVAAGNYLFANFVKQQMVEGTPHTYHFFPTKISNFPQADTFSLEQYTQEFINLGFQPVCDFSLEGQGGKAVSPGYARLFINHTYQCTAEVNQIFSEHKPAVVRIVITTVFSNNWSFYSTNREPDAVTHILRRPRILSDRHINKSLAEIFQAHIKRREQIATELGCTIQSVDFAEAYFAIELEKSKQIRPFLQKMNIFAAIIDGLIFEYFPKNEWLGDYAKHRKQIKG